MSADFLFSVSVPVINNRCLLDRIYAVHHRHVVPSIDPSTLVTEYLNRWSVRHRCPAMSMFQLMYMYALPFYHSCKY